MINAYQNNFNDMEWEDVREGVRRKIYTGEGATMGLNELQPGHEPKPHAHPYEQIVYIMQGEGDFNVDGQVYHLTPGGLLVIPPNVTHFLTVTGSEPVINLDIFTPKRLDYIR